MVRYASPLAHVHFRESLKVAQVCGGTFSRAWRHLLIRWRADMLRGMAVHIGTWQLEVRPMGWTRISDNMGGPTVYIQYAIPESAADTRLDMQAVVMEAGAEEPLTGRTWRASLRMVESPPEGPGVHHRIFSYPWDGPRPTCSLVEFFDSTTDKFDGQDREIGVRVVTGSRPQGRLPIIRALRGGSPKSSTPMWPMPTAGSLRPASRQRRRSRSEPRCPCVPCTADLAARGSCRRHAQGVQGDTRSSP
jgi:hypothetical protein